MFPSIGLWNRRIFLKYTRAFYSLLCWEHPGITQLEFIRQLFVQKPSETDAVYLDRISLYRIACQDALDWNYPAVLYTFYNISGRYFELLFAKRENEPTNVYLERMFARQVGDNNFTLTTRLSMLQLVRPDLEVWLNPGYLNISLPYYVAQYKKRPAENDKQFIIRLLQRYVNEKPLSQLKRQNFFSLVFPHFKLLRKRNITQKKFLRRNRNVIVGQVRVHGCLQIHMLRHE